MMDGQDDDDDGLGLLEEDFDEDDGLLVEEGQADEQGTVNGHYLDEGEPQYVQLSDYDDQRLLVENAVGEDDDEDVEEELLTEEQYFNAVQQQQQINHHVNGQDYNDELIYEITLKTEDN